MTIKQTSSNRDLALYLRLFRWARPYWTHLVGLFLLSLLATPLALLVPLPLKIALDSGLGSKPLPHLIRSFVPAGFRLTASSALLFAGQAWAEINAHLTDARLSAGGVKSLLAEFRASKALLEGHFLLSSGRHSAHYLQCARVLMDPARAALFNSRGPSPGRRLRLPSRKEEPSCEAPHRRCVGP